MSGLAPPIVTRRQTLNDYFEGFFEKAADGTLGIAKEITGAKLAEIDEIERTVGESDGFRVGAASTHARQERHLGEYRTTCILHFIKNGRHGELKIKNNQGPENDPLFFPDDREEFWKLLRFYLTWMAKQVSPRSSTDTRPRLATITNRRWSILHWTRVYMKSPPNFRSLQAHTNAALYFAVDKFGVNVDRREKPFFGRHELRYLIDHDLENTNAFDVAESHHAVWTLALVCGVRPGAIGWSTYRRNNYLRWKDIQIRRNLEFPNRFDMTVEFPYMKGFQDPSALENGHDVEGTLRLTLRAPTNPDNILLSPTVRILAIALKRGVLSRYNTLEDLLAGTHVEVMVSKEFLNEPMFLAATPGGRALIPKQPVSAHSLTDCLGKRAKDAGFKSGTMYAFRRKAATSVDRAAGRDAVRQFLHHAPNSKVFESSYEQVNFDLDVTAIALDEVQIPQEVLNHNAPILFRATLKVDHAALQARIDAYVNENIDKNLVGHQATLEARRLKRLAWKALHAENQAFQRERFTLDELKARQAEMRAPSKLMAMIEKRVKEQRNPNLHDLADEDLDELEDDDNEEGDERLDLEEVTDVQFGVDDEVEPIAEPDISVSTREEPAAINTTTLELETDRSFEAGQVFEVSYDLVLHMFLEVMLQGDSDQFRKGDPRPCPECLADDTIPTAKKLTVYKNNYDIQRHLESNYHSPLKIWLRRVTILQGKDEERLARCDCGRAYAHTNKFQNHLETIKEQGVGSDDPHFAQMTADGWLLPGFRTSRRSPLNEGRVRAERERERIEMGRALPQVEELTERRPSTVIEGAYSGPEDPVVTERMSAFMERTKHLPRMTADSVRAEDKANGTEGLYVEWVTEEEVNSEPSEHAQDVTRYLRDKHAVKKARK